MGERITELRRQENMTTSELSSRLGCSVRTLNNLENDRTRPSVNLIIKMAALFNVSIDYLCCQVEFPWPMNDILDQDPSFSIKECLNSFNKIQRATVLSFIKFIHKNNTCSDELIKLYDQLSESERVQVIGFMKGLLHSKAQ